jgi:hypothetical protein
VKDNPDPILIGEEFNLLTFRHEKSKGRFDDHWPFVFNAFINSIDLKEVEMIRRPFTWANSLPNPTFEKLDIVLMGVEWETKFPMVSVRVLERLERLSDDAPILLTTRAFRPQINQCYKFELGWLQQVGFHDMVKNVCDRPVWASSPILRWNKKMRFFMQSPYWLETSYSMYS